MHEIIFHKLTKPEVPEIARKLPSPHSTYHLQVHLFDSFLPPLNERNIDSPFPAWASQCVRWDQWTSWYPKMPWSHELPVDAKACANIDDDWKLDSSWGNSSHLSKLLENVDVYKKIICGSPQFLGWRLFQALRWSYTLGFGPLRPRVQSKRRSRSVVLKTDGLVAAATRSQLPTQQKNRRPPLPWRGSWSNALVARWTSSATLDPAQGSFPKNGSLESIGSAWWIIVDIFTSIYIYI